jgi:hypothetical protein
MKLDDSNSPISNGFKHLLQKMRTPTSVNAALALFRATPEELGKSAATAARKEKSKQK